MPAATELTPRVMMKGETPKAATPMPLTRPISMAAQKPAAAPATITSQTASGKS